MTSIYYLKESDIPLPKRINARDGSHLQIRECLQSLDKDQSTLIPYEQYGKLLSCISSLSQKRNQWYARREGVDGIRVWRV